MTKSPRTLPGTVTRRLLLLLGCLIPLLAGSAAAAADGQVITIVQLDGAIDPAYAGYLRAELNQAATNGYAAVVLRLSSSGSIKVDPEPLIRALCESPVPVVSWVGPNDAAVSGTATALWLAGDVRLVGPDAKVRSLTPAQPGGRSAAPNVCGPEDPLPTAATGTAGTIAEAVRSVEQVTRIDPDVATIRFANPGLVARVRQALATNPTLVYLLLLCGIGAIVFEAFQPGFGPAGWAGGLLVALSAYGLAGLPTNPAGLGLVLLGTAGMAYDVRRNLLGLATWGGAVGLVAGSWLFVHSDGPALRVPWPAVALGVAGSLVFYVVVMTVVLRALRGQSAGTGEALLGRTGEVRSPLDPQGHVLVEGALWRARTLEWDGAVPAGTRVTVTAVDTDALILDVEPVARLDA